MATNHFKVLFCFPTQWQRRHRMSDSPSGYMLAKGASIFELDLLGLIVYGIIVPARSPIIPSIIVESREDYCDHFLSKPRSTSYPASQKWQSFLLVNLSSQSRSWSRSIHKSTYISHWMRLHLVQYVVWLRTYKKQRRPKAEYKSGLHTILITLLIGLCC